MGNDVSLHIVIPVTAVSGATIGGIVAVSAKKSFEAELLCLQLSCFEYASFPLGDESPVSVTELKGRSAPLILAEFRSGKFDAGQYTFPFQLTLPRLPGTLEFFVRANFRAFIRTHLLVFFEKNGKKFRTAKEEIYIISPAYHSTLRINRSFKATSGCCCWQRFREGEVVLKLSLEKSAFVPGDAVVVHIYFFNSTDVQPRSLLVSLSRIVMLDNGVSSRSFETVMTSEKIKPVTGQQNVVLRIPVSDIGSHSYGKLCKKFFAVHVTSTGSSLKIDASLPLYIQPSVKIPPRNSPSLPLNWRPVIAPVRQLHVSQFEAYVDEEPSHRTFPGLRIS